MLLLYLTAPGSPLGAVGVNNQRNIWDIPLYGFFGFKVVTL